MSTLQQAMEMAAPEHPGRWVGAMVMRLIIVGGLIWLIVWAVRKARSPRPPQYPYPPAYYQQPPPGAPWPHQPPPPPGAGGDPPYPTQPGGAWPPQAPPPYAAPHWPQQPPPPTGPPPGQRS
ncbi:hypothetical protein [Mycolicibacterium psychrotolerans]|uniref:Uncharacterized protein n=1 Tax=Mycolicibacterium psychrotolerans TaxID=216929 RepID=A0A7I7M722_9MYCO|nr:hypothetical protein [Mycolicibacterium psychrotolerans]BBX67353.1 hypothetical protein MPSYJ_08140 [Mycolicibacterium psychrotolerans]